MAHLVMCWELGGDLGHVARMRPLAEALQHRGHRITFIVREPLQAERLLDPKRFSWLQAPYQARAVPTPLAPTLSFAAVMYNCGFHAAAALRGRLRAWRNLYSVLQPDLLVFDHSPTAMLAARDLEIPRIALGTGFCIPPAVRPLPLFDPAAGGSVAHVEDQVLAVANQALAGLGNPPIRRLADIYQANAGVFFTLKELDHYSGRGSAGYWGPTRQDSGVAPAWPATAGRRIFAYLKPFKTLQSLLEALRDSGQAVLVYLAKGAEDLAQKYAGERMTFSHRPVDLGRAVADADLVICHAGHGTISAALLGGKPLLLLPLNMEQRMLAARVVELGGGLAAPALAPEGMRQKLQRLLAEPGFTAAAGRFAERYRDLKIERIPERFADLVERLFASEAP